MLKYRLIIGPALVVLLLLIVWLDDQIDDVALPAFLTETIWPNRQHPPRGLLLFAVGLLILPIAARELSRIIRANGIATRTWLFTVAAWLGLTLNYAIPVGMRESPEEFSMALAIIPTGLIVVFVASLLTFSRDRKVTGVAAAAGAVVFVMLYLGLMPGFLIAIRRWHSGWWIVGIILTTKACDSGAFFVGKMIGRHKLIPWLSPGKTWEGLFGGIVVAALFGTAMAAASTLLPNKEDHLPWWFGTICGVIFAIVGQFGDLTMSIFKRGAGVKDSSNLLPGLGGAMDVLDSPLMVAPVAYWLLMLAA